MKMPRTHLLRGGNNSELDRVLVIICMVEQILCMVVAKMLPLRVTKGQGLPEEHRGLNPGIRGE